MILEPLDPAHVLRDAVAAMSGFAYQRGVAMEERLPEALPLVHADADRLKQVFINLIHNAIKFSANSEPRVIVSAEVRDGKAVLKVGDNGPGIAAGERSTVFQKFSRRGRTAEGSGLGLAICRQIVEAHGGVIGIASAPVSGSIFEVGLPLMKDDARP